MAYLVMFLLTGVIFYYVFKSYSTYEAYTKESMKDYMASPDAIKNSDLGLFVALVAKVAKADGKVDTLEAELVGLMFDDVSAVFPEPEKTREILKEIFNTEKDRKDNIKEIAARLGEATRKNTTQQEKFVAFLIQLAFADGNVSSEEEELLKTIAEALRFNPGIYHQIFDHFEEMIKNIKPQHSTKNAYDILGVNESDDMDTIKKAYRKLIKQYHPDIIASQTHSEEHMEKATAKTQEINQAYELIKKTRGV
ncbi:DnaJ domain-containing protein [Sulfurimonas sp. C5]|uniref:DnaJ domain-containing protein n=1 Tax=Sulfurimonas sp. C5 TaxID=3036947 RepID=UPI0024552577|nr:DnaJ domain-containing protein [Sulfurimonas sp. C5]MDH4945413.1 TerB family tellurite resistance protein [Sulfurimonas sp. C5]